MKWQLSAFLAMLSFSFSFLCFRKLCDAGVSAALQLACVSGIMLAGSAAIVWWQGNGFGMARGPLLYALLAGVLCVAGNCLQLHALGRAVNPGYALAIIAANVAVVSVLSALWLGTPLHLSRVLGILLCGAGVFLVSR